MLGRRIEAARRFIEEKYFRASPQRSRDLHASLHTRAIRPDKFAAKIRIKAYFIQNALERLQALAFAV